MNNDILKGELGFDGFVVSGWQGIDQIPGDRNSDVRIGINAGIDMVMVLSTTELSPQRCSRRSGWAMSPWYCSRWAFDVNDWQRRKL